jgi:protocatechuate 3,4-dioxygenase alpha subunit
MTEDVMTPSQTSGPLYGFALIFEDSECMVERGSPGAIELTGLLSDGGGPVGHPDAFLEVWQGDQWARSRTDVGGVFRFVVQKPAATPLPNGAMEAPYLNVSVFARGLLRQAKTRMYFPDEEQANAGDPVLQLVSPQDRQTLIARSEGEGLRFDICLQGEAETVFFEPQ